MALDISNNEEYGIVSYHLLLREITGSAAPAISRGFFIPDGARVHQVLSHIYLTTSGTALRWEVSQNPINHGPNVKDEWYPLENDGATQFSIDAVQGHAHVLQKTEYDSIKGWVRLVTNINVAANSRYWIEVKVRMPYSYILKNLGDTNDWAYGI